MTKKIIILMVVALMSATSIFAQGGTTGPLTWNLSGGTLTINGTGAMPNYDWGGAPWYPYAASIDAVVIENGVTTIGDHAFMYCYALNSVTLGNNITTLGMNAFHVCYSLESLTLPNSLTTIVMNAFYGCSALTSITIPKNVTTIGIWAFFNCTSLISIEVENGNANYSSIDGALFDKEKNTLICCPGGRTQYSIPSGIKIIGDGAFAGSAIISVTLPSSVTTIGVEVFSYCNAFTSIEVENGNANYSSIDEILFDKEKTILICYPAGKTNSNYTIPNSVKVIGSGAFKSCKSLNLVTFGSSVTTIGDYAFSQCYVLDSVTLGNSVTTIGNSAFSSCGALTSITLPNSVTTIEYYAFGSCSALRSVNLGNSVTTIGSSVFYYCTALNLVTNLNSEPVEISSGLFYGVEISTCTLKVLGNSIGAYRDAPIWQDFNIVGVFFVSVSVNNNEYGTATGCGYYDENAIATVTATAHTGYKFVNWTKNGTEISTDNPYSFTVTEDVELIANFEEEVGVENFEFSTIKIYPNPTIGQLKIESEEMKIEDVDVFDIFGKKVFSQKSLISPTMINISHLSAGVYFVRIQTEEGEVIKKVLKE